MSPARICDEADDDYVRMERVLAETLREVYKPCGEWKKRQEQWMKDRLEYHIQVLFDSGRNFLRALAE
jgi:hypothetical protein